MTWDWQTSTALAVIALAAGEVARRAWQAWGAQTPGGCNHCGHGACHDPALPSELVSLEPPADWQSRPPKS